MRLLGAVIFSAAALCAQPIGFGVKGGVPFTDAFDVASGRTSQFSFQTQRWIVGPQVELRLPLGFAVEADALYSKLQFNSLGSSLLSTVDSNSWEFPILLKYKLGGPSVGVASVRPFVGAGASFRRLGDVASISQFVTGRSGASGNTGRGFVVGGGLEVKALFLRISPEIRFTRWGTDNLIEGVSNIYQLNRNQAQFLVGFTF